jgi:hydroxymethylglutaryl-CoA lyase
MSSRVRIIEVGPRDGLQNEQQFVPTDVKIRLIRSLVAAGITEIEATSFVSPKWVPQLADAADLWPLLPVGPLYSALVPNERGLDRAIQLGVNRIALFTATSDSFTQRNINMSVEQSLSVFDDLISSFRVRMPSSWIRGYVSTAFECPYEGRIAPNRTAEITRRLFEMGVDEVSVGDTIGVAGPSEVRVLTDQLLNSVPLEKVAYHFHDTHGTGIANVAQAMEQGITTFDSSAGGLGGCPYAPGAGGNLATEDLVYFLERSGVTTGIDLYQLAAASLEVLDTVGRQPSAKSQLAQLSLSGTSPK